MWCICTYWKSLKTEVSEERRTRRLTELSRALCPFSAGSSLRKILGCAIYSSLSSSPLLFRECISCKLCPCNIFYSCKTFLISHKTYRNTAAGWNYMAWCLVAASKNSAVTHSPGRGANVDRKYISFLGVSCHQKGSLTWVVSLPWMRSNRS